MARSPQHRSKRPAKIGGVSMAEFMLRLATRHPRPLGPEGCVPTIDGSEEQ